MTNYDIETFVNTFSDTKDFLSQITKEVSEKKKILSNLVTSADCSEYCYCDGRTKHAIRLLVYPYSYDRFIRTIVSEYVKENKTNLMSWYAKKQIEYIESLNERYVLKEMKETLIQKIEQGEMKEIRKSVHRNFVAYIKTKTDEILEKEIDG